MATQLHEVEFETRTIGPLVLTTPVLRRLGFREMVNRHCPIAEQAELDHGLVAELVTQSRLSDPTALYDLPGWAERFAIATLYPEIERTGQVNDDRAGRMLDVLYDQRAVIWGDLVATACPPQKCGLRSPRSFCETVTIVQTAQIENSSAEMIRYYLSLIPEAFKFVWAHVNVAEN